MVLHQGAKVPFALLVFPFALPATRSEEPVAREPDSVGGGPADGVASRTRDRGRDDRDDSEDREATGFAPLAGVRIVDFSQNLAGPYATQVLADMGADVVKVEPPGGDPARAWGPPFVGGQSPLFQIANRNKRSVVLDLKDGRDRVLALKLAAGADVVAEAFRRGVADRLGIGYEAVRSANPSVVYVSVSAHGDRGTLRDAPGYDPLMQARSGLMSVTGEAGGQPVRTGASVVDLGTGVWTAAAVLGALRAREQSGRGRRVEVSLLDASLALMSYHLTSHLATGKNPSGLGTAIGMIAPYEAFPCADGGSVMIAAGNDGIFARLCRALELDELAARPEFARNAGRVAARGRLAAAIAARTGRMDAPELLARLEEHGVPAAPVHTVADAVADPQVIATGMLRRGGHPWIDGYVDIASPVWWDGRRTALRRFPPRAGEHQGEVLAALGEVTGPRRPDPAPESGVARDARVRGLRSLLAAAAALGTRDEILVRKSLVAAASRCKSTDIDELLLMSCFVTGFPAGLAALNAWAGVRPEGECNRLNSTVPADDSTDSTASAADRGELACRAVYGSRYDALLDHLRSLHPDLPELVVTCGYGAMMARPAMALRVRELCMIAMLVPWRAETQLYAHLRGTLETGAAAHDVERAIAAGGAAARAVGQTGEDAEDAATRTWKRVAQHWQKQLLSGAAARRKS